MIECSSSYVQRGSEGVTVLRLHWEHSLPAPAAWNDLLTHFLPAAPADCQGEPLLEDEGESKRELDIRKGEKKWKQETRGTVERKGGRERRRSLEFVSCLRPGTKANSSSLELMASRSVLPATNTTQTSVNALLRMRTHSDVHCNTGNLSFLTAHCAGYNKLALFNTQAPPINSSAFY